MAGDSPKSGPVYSNLSFIKRALYQSPTRSLPFYDIVLDLLKNWRSIGRTEAEQFVIYALYAKRSFFEEDLETGLWSVKRHNDPNLSIVVEFLKKKPEPLSVKQLAQKLKWRDESSLLIGLSCDLRFTSIQSKGTEYWMLSDWILVNDHVYSFLIDNKQETITWEEATSIMTTDIGFNPEEVIFAPDIDERFYYHLGLIRIDLIEDEEVKSPLLLEDVPVEINEEVARSSLLICKYIQSCGQASAKDIIHDIFNTKSYEKVYPLYKLSLEKFLGGIGQISLNEQSNWEYQVSASLELGEINYWDYSVYNSVPVIPNAEQLIAIEIDQPSTIGEKSSDISNKKGKNKTEYIHHITYYERVKGYLLAPKFWSEMNAEDRGIISVNVDGYLYSWLWKRHNGKVYFYGNGIKDLFFDFSLEPGHELKYYFNDESSVDIFIGEINKDIASEQARYLDIGKLVEESQRVNKSFFTIMCEILATYPAGMHWTNLLNKVNALRMTTKNTIYNILSQNECFVQVDDNKKGYWRIDITKLSRFYTDESGTEIEEDDDLDIPDFVQSTSKEKTVRKKRTRRKQIYTTQSLWNEFSKWASKQRGIRYETAISKSKSKEDLVSILFPAYAKLLCRFASSRKRYYIEEMDLVQEGFFGFIRAVELYSPDQGVSFGNYAKSHVLSKMLRKMIDSETLIRLPVHIHEKLRSLDQYINAFIYEQGKWPEYNDLYNEYGLGINEIICLDTHRKIDYISFEVLWSEDIACNMLGSLYSSAILDAKSKPLYHDEKDIETLVFELDFLNNCIEIDTEILWDAIIVDDVVNRRILKDVVIKQLLNKLNEKEEQVIRLRFGLDDGIERTLEAVGEYFNLTRERVRQIEKKALGKLHTTASNLELDVFIQ
ncbi:sigma-70 family RNA polymerase sigma factor [Paenibacillus sp. 843]|uniref:sigma-70 family RNA polymerase sigma factor n=1 Tax=Paenibacillus sp. 843 TaxID=3341795 RepID=UPI00372A0D1C